MLNNYLLNLFLIYLFSGQQQSEGSLLQDGQEAALDGRGSAGAQEGLVEHMGKDGGDTPAGANPFLKTRTDFVAV